MELDTPTARKKRWSPTRMIQAIDLALSPEFQPGAFTWTDKNYDNAWSKATDEFQEVLTRYQKAYENFKPGMEDYMWEKSQRYIQTVTHYFKLYKKHIGKSDTEALIESVEKQGEQYDIRNNKTQTRKQLSEGELFDLRRPQKREDNICRDNQQRQGSLAFSN